MCSFPSAVANVATIYRLKCTLVLVCHLYRDLPVLFAFVTFCVRALSSHVCPHSCTQYEHALPYVTVIDIADQNAADVSQRHESDLDRKRRFEFIYASHVWVRRCMLSQ